MACPVQAVPVANIGPVGYTEPPAGSTVMASVVGPPTPAEVKVAWSGDRPRSPSEIERLPLAPRAQDEHLSTVPAERSDTRRRRPKLHLKFNSNVIPRDSPRNPAIATSP